MNVKELWNDNEKRPYLLTGIALIVVLAVVFGYLSATKTDEQGTEKLTTNEVATISEITTRYLTVSGNYGAEPISDSSEFYPRLKEIYRGVEEKYITKFSAYYDMKMAYLLNDTTINVLYDETTISPIALPIKGGFYTVSSENIEIEEPKKYFLNSADEKTVVLDFSMDTTLVWYAYPNMDPEVDAWDKTFKKVVDNVENEGRLTLSQQLDGEWKIVNVELNASPEEGGLLAFDDRGVRWNNVDEDKVEETFKVDEYPTTNVWLDQQACVANNVCDQ